MPCVQLGAVNMPFQTKPGYSRSTLMMAALSMSLSSRHCCGGTRNSPGWHSPPAHSADGMPSSSPQKISEPGMSSSSRAASTLACTSSGTRGEMGDRSE